MQASRVAAELLSAARQGRVSLAELRDFGDRHPTEFFRDLVEPLADSFEPHDASVYEAVMQAWLPRAERAEPAIPDRVETVYVLSRVTLGADVKVTNIVLDAMK